MDAQQNQKKSISRSKKEANAILSTNANRLLLIEAILICMVFVALFVAMNAAFMLCFPIVKQLSVAWAFVLNVSYFVLVNLLTVFLVGPVLLGLLRIAEQMQAGRSPTLSELFYFLSNADRHYRGWTVFWGIAWRLALGMALMHATQALFASALFDLPASDWLLNALLLAEGIGVIALLLSRYSACFYALRHEQMPLWEVRYAVRQHRRSYGHCGARFFFSFLGWILLGFVSIGLLLLIDVIPRMLLTYVCDCDRNHLPS